MEQEEVKEGTFVNAGVEESDEEENVSFDSGKYLRAFNALSDEKKLLVFVLVAFLLVLVGVLIGIRVGINEATTFFEPTLRECASLKNLLGA